MFKLLIDRVFDNIKGKIWGQIKDSFEKSESQKNQVSNNSNNNKITDRSTTQKNMTIKKRKEIEERKLNISNSYNIIVNNYYTTERINKKSGKKKVKKSCSKHQKLRKN